MIEVTKEFKDFIERYYQKPSGNGLSNFGSNGNHQTHGTNGIGINSIYISILNDNMKKYKNPEIISSFIALVHEYSQFENYNYHTFSNKSEECKKILDNMNFAIQESINQNIRSKVTGKHYNFLRNIFEYELESGDFIPCENSKPFMHTIPPSIFPREFLLLYDTGLHRTAIINDIIE